jgi:hypothetical protein
MKTTGAKQAERPVFAYLQAAERAIPQGGFALCFWQAKYLVKPDHFAQQIRPPWHSLSIPGLPILGPSHVSDDADRFGSRIRRSGAPGLTVQIMIWGRD